MLRALPVTRILNTEFNFLTCSLLPPRSTRVARETNFYRILAQLLPPYFA